MRDALPKAYCFATARRRHEGRDIVQDLRTCPKLLAALKAAAGAPMKKDEIDRQRASFVRGMKPMTKAD